MVIQVVWTSKGVPPTVKINQEDVRWEDLELRLAQIYLKRVEKVAFVRGDADVDFSVCRRRNRSGASRRRAARWASDEWTSFARRMTTFLNVAQILQGSIVVWLN